MDSRKGQSASLISVVVGGVLALIIGAIVIYSVGFPLMTGINSTINQTGNAPANQFANFQTVLTLLGVMAIIVALVVFMSLARMAG
jgi:hypothetical protein